jgi:hypothetical protein
MMNTQTLEITGHWGKTGKATLANTHYSNFLLHGMDQTPNPAYTLLSAVGNTEGAFIWNNKTTVLTQVGLAGHHGVGYNSLYCSNTAGGDFIGASYEAPGIHTQVIPAVNLPANQVPPQHMIGDEHCDFGNINPNDASLLWVTYGPPMPFPFTSCWMGELTGVDVTGAVTKIRGTVVRACHTYNSGRSPFYEITAAMPAPFQSGRYVAFCSDMDGANRTGTLGQINGQPRGDVFIADIASAAHL